MIGLISVAITCMYHNIYYMYMYVHVNVYMTAFLLSVVTSSR